MPDFHMKPLCPPWDASAPKLGAATQVQVLLRMKCLLIAKKEEKEKIHGEPELEW